MKRFISRVCCCALRRRYREGTIATCGIGRPIEEDDVTAIWRRMREIVDADIPFHRIQSPTEDAIEMFRRQGMTSKVRLLESYGAIYTHYYQLDQTVDYFYGSLLTSTGGLKVFDVMKYYDGLLLRIPSRKNPENWRRWYIRRRCLKSFGNIIVGRKSLDWVLWAILTKACQEGRTTELINVAEALQEKKIVRIADEIQSRRNLKLILIAGPSSSGKTTFSKRLSIQLMANGIKPYPISLDDYFLDREHTPRDEHGEYDFESLYALDLPFFNSQLQALLAGEEVELPHFNFQTGVREKSGKKLRLEDHMILILEGIHGLNPELTAQIEEQYKYRIYVSAMTTILLDAHNYIPTTDNRLLRRIIRDYKYRGYSALDTIRRWPSVREGEDKWIFPYQEEADAMFNSALLFELAVIRNQALPILERVPENVPEYSEAYRLRKFLRYFVPMADDEIPPTSLLRDLWGEALFILGIVMTASLPPSQEFYEIAHHPSVFDIINS